MSDSSSQPLNGSPVSQAKTITMDIYRHPLDDELKLREKAFWIRNDQGKTDLETRERFERHCAEEQNAIRKMYEKNPAGVFLEKAVHPGLTIRARPIDHGMDPGFDHVAGLIKERDASILTTDLALHQQIHGPLSHEEGELLKQQHVPAHGPIFRVRDSYFLPYAPFEESMNKPPNKTEAENLHEPVEKAKEDLQAGEAKTASGKKYRSTPLQKIKKSISPPSEALTLFEGMDRISQSAETIANQTGKLFHPIVRLGTRSAEMGMMGVNPYGQLEVGSRILDPNFSQDSIEGLMLHEQGHVVNGDLINGSRQRLLHLHEVSNAPITVSAFWKNPDEVAEAFSQREPKEFERLLAVEHGRLDEMSKALTPALNHLEAYPHPMTVGGVIHDIEQGDRLRQHVAKMPPVPLHKQNFEDVHAPLTHLGKLYKPGDPLRFAETKAKLEALSEKCVPLMKRLKNANQQASLLYHAEEFRADAYAITHATHAQAAGLIRFLETIHHEWEEAAAQGNEVAIKLLKEGAPTHPVPTERIERAGNLVREMISLGRMTEQKLLPSIVQL